MTLVANQKVYCYKRSDETMIVTCSSRGRGLANMQCFITKPHISRYAITLLSIEYHQPFCTQSSQLYCEYEYNVS